MRLPPLKFSLCQVDRKLSSTEGPWASPRNSSVEPKIQGSLKFRGSSIRNHIDSWKKTWGLEKRRKKKRRGEGRGRRREEGREIPVLLWRSAPSVATRGCKPTSWGPWVPYSVYHTPALAGNSLSDTLYLCVFTQSSGVLQSSQYDDPNICHLSPLSSVELVWTHGAIGPPSDLRPLDWGSTAFWALMGPWVDRRPRSWEFITTWVNILVNPFSHLRGSSLKDHLLVSPGFVLEVFHSQVLWVLFSIVLSKAPSIAF